MTIEIKPHFFKMAGTAKSNVYSFDPGARNSVLGGEGKIAGGWMGWRVIAIRAAHSDRHNDCPGLHSAPLFRPALSLNSADR